MNDESTVGCEDGTRRGDLPKSLVLLATTAFYLPMSVLSVGWITWRHSWSEVQNRIWSPHAIDELIIGALCGVAIVLACHLARLTIGLFEGLVTSFARALGPIGAGTALTLAAVSSIGEELLFRATLQPGLGLVLTSVLFGVLHVPFERNLWLWPLFAAGTGLLLGWLYQRHGCVLAPTMAHFVVNAIHLEIIRRRAKRIHGLRLHPASLTIDP